jgi:Mycothiol maleylpyruvate isomerase N-terminal domain
VTDHIARHFIAAAQLAGRLVTAPEVRERWADESACAGMTVGGLAHHLAGQAENVVLLLEPAPGAEEPIPVAEHYRRADWVTSALDDEPNTSIRDESNDDASGGPEELAADVERVLGALPSALAPSLAGKRTPDTVFVPWQGWSLTTEDFLVTRLMEIMVHSDDLAASVGLETPEFSGPVVEAVLGLLSAVAVDRHGQAAVLRALSRPQRAPDSVSAF